MKKAYISKTKFKSGGKSVTRERKIGAIVVLPAIVAVTALIAGSSLVYIPRYSWNLFKYFWNLFK